MTRKATMQVLDQMLHETSLVNILYGLAEVLERESSPIPENTAWHKKAARRVRNAASDIDLASADTPNDMELNVEIIHDMVCENSISDVLEFLAEASDIPNYTCGEAKSPVTELIKSFAKVIAQIEGTNTEDMPKAKLVDHSAQVEIAGVKYRFDPSHICENFGAHRRFIVSFVKDYFDGSYLVQADSREGAVLAAGRRSIANYDQLLKTDNQLGKIAHEYQQLSLDGYFYLRDSLTVIELS